MQNRKNNLVFLRGISCVGRFFVMVLLCYAAQAGASQDYLIAPSGGDITGAQLSAQLSAGNVTLQSSQGRQAGTGNIIVNDVVSWSSNYTLTLNASNSVIVGKNIVASGGSAGLVISPKTANGGEQPTSTGSFQLSQSSITLSGSSPSLMVSGLSYKVINSLGQPGDASTPPATPTLQGMAADSNLSGNYALGSDINAAAASAWNTGAGFKPVGATAAKPFTGKFEGFGHKIRNLTINSSAQNGVGLFGVIASGAQVQNVGLVNATIIGNGNVGALAGNNRGEIYQSYADGSVTGSNVIGGLVGFNAVGARILRSYAFGKVNITSFSAGSLVGKNSGLIQDCYATGSVSGGGTAWEIGGLVGNHQKATGGDATILNSYSVGSVSGQKSGGEVGGLVGKVQGGGVVTNGYWNTQTSGQSTSAGGTGLTTQQMQTQSSFTGFDFAATWTIVEGQAYPQLAFQSVNSNIIYDINQLQLMQNNLNGDYILGASIDASATSGGGSWGTGGFKPIGSASAPFTGTLEGDGYTISNLMINQPTMDNVGLFGYTSNTARISNVGMKDAQITGQNNVGSLVGYNNATIHNSNAHGVNISAMGNASSGSGGLVGLNAGTINNGSSGGNLTGIDDVGGLVGFNQGQINNSRSWAAVSAATGQAGGLVGTNQQAGSITGSYASGPVSTVGTTEQIGGLVGLNNGSISYSNALGIVNCGSSATCGGLVAQNGANTVNASISNSYATGGVAGSGVTVGGLVGNNATGSTVSQTYALGALQGQTNVGGLIGNNQGSITNSYWNKSLIQSGVGTGAATGATGLTAAQMLVSTNYAGFTVTTTAGASGWVVINTDGTLQSVASSTPAATMPMLATEYSTQISNAHQLQLMLMNSSAGYSVTADIDASRTGNGNDVWGALGFVPVGSASAPFSGVFDGKQRKIRALRIDRADNNVGLFGYTNTATINNVKLIDAQIVGGNRAGVLAGTTSGGSINNSYAQGYVSGKFTYTSGKGDNIGVLVGYNNATITQSASAGIAYGGNYVGGLVGYNTGAINNSYSTSHANARAKKSQDGETNVFSGGLVGYNDAGSVNNAYATGGVICKIKENAGGLVGDNDPRRSGFGPITNSYWDITTSGVTESAGGTGLTDAQMRQQSSFAGWDFTNTWQMNTYPVLRSMPVP